MRGLLLPELVDSLKRHRIHYEYDYRIESFTFKPIVEDEIEQALEYCFGGGKMKSIVLSAELIEMVTSEELIDFLTASLL